MVITPQLRQAIKLLQFSAIELQSYIENEVRENPLLSAEERSDHEGARGAGPETTANPGGEADVPAFDAHDATQFETVPDFEPDTSPGERTYEGEPAALPAASEWAASGSSKASPPDDEPDPIPVAGHLERRMQIIQFILNVLP